MEADVEESRLISAARVDSAELDDGLTDCERAKANWAEQDKSISREDRSKSEGQKELM